MTPLQRAVRYLPVESWTSYVGHAVSGQEMVSTVIHGNRISDVKDNLLACPLLDASEASTSRNLPATTRSCLSSLVSGLIRWNSFQIVSSKLLRWSNKLVNFLSKICALLWALPNGSLDTADHWPISPKREPTLEDFVVLLARRPLSARLICWLTPRAIMILLGSLKCGKKI